MSNTKDYRGCFLSGYDIRGAYVYGGAYDSDTRECYLLGDYTKESREAFAICGATGSRNAQVRSTTLVVNRTGLVVAGVFTPRTGYVPAGVGQGDTEGFVNSGYARTNSGYLAAGIGQGSATAYMEAYDPRGPHKTNVYFDRDAYVHGKPIRESDAYVIAHTHIPRKRSAFVSGVGHIGSLEWHGRGAHVTGVVNSIEAEREARVAGAGATEVRSVIIRGGPNPYTVYAASGNAYKFYGEH